MSEIGMFHQFSRDSTLASNKLTGVRLIFRLKRIITDTEGYREQHLHGTTSNTEPNVDVESPKVVPYSTFPSDIRPLNGHAPG